MIITRKDKLDRERRPLAISLLLPQGRALVPSLTNRCASDPLARRTSDFRIYRQTRQRFQENIALTSKPSDTLLNATLPEYIQACFRELEGPEDPP